MEFRRGAVSNHLPYQITLLSPTALRQHLIRYCYIAKQVTEVANNRYNLIIAYNLISSCVSLQCAPSYEGMTFFVRNFCISCVLIFNLQIPRLFLGKKFLVIDEKTWTQRFFNTFLKI